jgi:hypothetical protein
MKSRKWTMQIILLALALLMLSVAFFAFKPAYAQEAYVWTDREDYAPEETVTIYGAGFTPYSTVTVSLTRPDGHIDQWSIAADSSGSFTTTYQLDGIAGTYTVTATDGINTAATTFTDASLTYTPSNVNLSVAAGSSVSFTLKLSDKPNQQTNYTRKELIAKAGYIHMNDSWVTTDPYSFTAGPGNFTQEINVTITVPSDATVGNYAAVLKYTPREGSGCEIYLTVAAQPRVNITITSSPVTGACFVKVDGAAITTPATFTWTVGSTHTLEALSPVEGPTSTRYVWTSWSDGKAQTHTYTVPSSSEAVTANYVVQYLLTVVTDPKGLSPQPTRNPTGESGTANGWWYDSGTNVTLTAQTVGGYVFNQWDIDGTSQGSGNTTITVVMNAPHTATAIYSVVPATATVTFSQIGVGTDFTGVVLTVDSVNYSVLSISFNWTVGSNHTFAYHSPLLVGTDKRYVWASTAGLSMLQSGTITVSSGGGTVTGYYNTQYSVIVGQSGVGGDFAGTVVVVDGVSLKVADLPRSYWWYNGSSHSFAFQSPLTVDAAKQYVWISTSGLSTAKSDSLVITGSGSIIGNYEVYVPPAQVDLTCQCYVTDGSFKKIGSFTTIFTRVNYATYRLSSTKPNAFYYCIQITNPGATGVSGVVLSFQLDPEFVIVGSDPVQVHTGYGRIGSRVSATVSYNLNSGTVNIASVGAGQTLYVTISMDYKFKGQTFTRSQALSWVENHPSNKFSCTLERPVTHQCSATIKDPAEIEPRWTGYVQAATLIGLTLTGFGLAFKLSARRGHGKGKFQKFV